MNENARFKPLRKYNDDIPASAVVTELRIEFDGAPDVTRMSLYSNTRHEVAIKVFVSFYPDSVQLTEEQMQQCAYLCNAQDTDGGTDLSSTPCTWSTTSTGYNESIPSTGKTSSAARPRTTDSSMTAYVTSKSQGGSGYCAIAAGICINGTTYTTRSFGPNAFNCKLDIELLEPIRYTKDDIALKQENVTTISTSVTTGYPMTIDHDNYYLEFTNTKNIIKTWTASNVDYGFSDGFSLFGFHYSSHTLRNLVQFMESQTTTEMSMTAQTTNQGFENVTNSFSIRNVNLNHRPTAARFTGRIPDEYYQGNIANNWNVHPYFTVYDAYGNSVKVTLYKGDDDDNTIKIEAIDDEPV
ncbi:hypothetical protein [Paraburkholderia solisilvae]|uniref:Uncharacterized protein n=1 Tax=Paraburkholderia solisilvae TaxID=624376 RepID=A0A6J5EMZ0_9BURK|nr:hypothetical protein [Paraburkholderia solisilvae]CAB3767067.1 hypothetical protein LMG29739_04969 [Paraburkholderia solisilvae]